MTTTKNKQPMENSIPVKQIIGRFMVRFEKLGQLIPYAYMGSNAHSIDIFVDMYGIYKHMFSRHFYTCTNDYLEFTAALVSLCSHYRTYFRYIRVYPRIYFISSFNVPEFNCKSVAGYNKVMIDKLMNKDVMEMVTLNIDLMKTLTQYLPSIYFVHTDFESTVLIRHIIRKNIENGDIKPNMIISSDIYPLQLLTEFSGTTLLRPMKSNGADVSEIVVPVEHQFFRSSFWNYVSNRDANLKYDPRNITISPVNFPLFTALSSFRERNMKAMCNYTMANKYIYQAIGNSDSKMDVDTFYMANENIDALLPRTTLECRYNSIDATGYQYSLFENSVEPSLLAFNDLSNPEALNLINSTYFEKDPLDFSNI